MFIDSTYFVGDIDIPNTGKDYILSDLNRLINKREPEFLQAILGHELYKALMDAVAIPGIPEERFQDLIYGKEYTDLTGVGHTWQGLISTSAPDYSFGSNAGFSYKTPVMLQAGVTSGLAADVTTATFEDWIGWTPIIERIGAGTMKLNVDYTFDALTGDWALLKTGDKFAQNEYFFVQFQLKVNDASAAIVDPYKQSLIANYIYYWYMRQYASQTTGIGEVQTNGDNAVNVSPAIKVCRAWNDMVTWLKELHCFLDANTTTYPEWLNVPRAHVDNGVMYFRYPKDRSFLYINQFGI